ncbi:MAG TPA: GDSL-type esterase/lipase family protein [Acidimicrobiales bacterium]|nr:GDSL-type esterase/lipase family protein [Acidimicrobiales bacterium]
MGGTGRRQRLPMLGGDLLRRVHPGWAQTSATIGPFAEAWAAVNEEARAGTGPLWVALGDSTGQAIGAASPDGGYVGAVRKWLDERSGRRWRVVNLSVSGARAVDVLTAQLPALEGLPAPDLVTVAVGTNDVVRRTPLAALEATLADVFGRLPAGAVVATLPRGLGRSRPAAVNRLIERLAGELDLVVADVWARTGPPWRGKFSADGFHPNESGYADWAAAFTEAMAPRWEAAR